MEAVLIFQSYEISIWEEITPGMMFTYLEKDSDYIKIRTIGENERHNKEEFIRDNGHPVKPYICAMDGTVIAQPEEIGWWDCGDDCDSYMEIGEADFNTILQECEGLIDIETTYDDDEGHQILYVDGKVIISIFQKSEEEFSNDVHENFTPNEPYNYDNDQSEEW
jgi:hypothetical protein